MYLKEVQPKKFVSWQACMFVIVTHFRPSLLFADEARVYSNITGLHSIRLQRLSLAQKYESRVKVVYCDKHNRLLLVNGVFVRSQ
jgi:hypothetical protein